MRKIICLSLLIIAFITFHQTANAQDKRLNSAPKAFRAFFAQFKNAVEKSDKSAAANITIFPFKYGFDAGDEGSWTRKQFVKNFNKVFGDNPKKFFAERNPSFSRGDGGSYIISTEDAAHLIFVKKGNVFKFASYIVEP